MEAYLGFGVYSMNEARYMSLIC